MNHQHALMPAIKDLFPGVNVALGGSPFDSNECCRNSQLIRINKFASFSIEPNSRETNLDILASHVVFFRTSYVPTKKPNKNTAFQHHNTDLNDSTTEHLSVAGSLPTWPRLSRSSVPFDKLDQHLSGILAGWDSWIFECPKIPFQQSVDDV